MGTCRRRGGAERQRKLDGAVWGRDFQVRELVGFFRFGYKTPVAWRRTVVEQGEAHCAFEFTLESQQHVKVLLSRWEHVPPT